MRGVCCVVLIVMLTCSAKAESIVPEHPKCRTINCLWDEQKVHGSEFYYYVNGTTGVRAQPNQQIIVRYNDMGSFLLWCNSHPRQTKNRLPADDPALPAMPRLLTVKTVEIRGCTVPTNSSYYDVLAALNVTFSSEMENTTLNLTQLPAEPPLEGYHMERLPIKKLSITANNVDPQFGTRPKINFLDRIQELHTLELKENVVLEHNVIEHLPKGLVTLYLVNTQLPAAESKLNNGSYWLERLHSLKVLHLVESSNIPRESKRLKLIPPPLASLPNLTMASLYHVPLEKLPENWLKGSKLQTLILKSCGIEELPDNLFKGANLTRLYLINNRLSSLPPGVFSPLQWLKELDLTNNNLISVHLVDALLPLKRLETLKVNNNTRLGSLCGDNSIIQGIQSSRLPKSLRRLELIKTGATRICDDWTQMHLFLKYLALDGNNISDLRFADLMLMRNASMVNTPVTLSLLNNALERIEVTREDYESCLDAKTRDWRNPIPAQVKLRLKKLACDCYDGYWLRETLRHCSLLTLDRDIACTPKPPALEPKWLLAHEPQDFTCPYHGYCTPGCGCQRRASDNATVMRCTGPLPSESQWPPSAPEWPLALHVPPGALAAVPPVALVELYAPSNNITKLDKKDIPTTLRVLDVRNNSIAHITTDAAQQLLNLRASGSRVWISGNQLACTCEDAPAIAKLKLAEILDWNMTLCVDGNYVMGKTMVEMCENKIMAPLLGVTGTVLIIIIALLVLRRLQPYIRQFLFDHNMCLKWVLNVKDDPDDPMKTHDAFISYSYSDYEYAKKLIEKLEEHGYSTIEHCRDWLPGKSVTQQIVHSVMSARRTLLLVSDNFANSKWGLEEFHAAHAHAIEHGSARVIVVRCKLLAPHELPPELQLYLYNNTYLDWSDRYFWNKLWRVMPTLRGTPTTAIALIPNPTALPSIQIQRTRHKANATALPQPRLSTDKDPPLSELVLAVSAEDSPRQSSGRTPPFTPTTRQPLSSNNKNTSPSQKIQHEQLTAPVISAAVSPCAC